MAAFKKELASYEKYARRFPLTKPISKSLIGDIAKLRAKEMAEELEKKAAAKKKR